MRITYTNLEKLQPFHDRDLQSSMLHYNFTQDVFTSFQLNRFNFGGNLLSHIKRLKIQKLIRSEATVYLLILIWRSC